MSIMSILIPRRIRRLRVSRDMKVKFAWSLFISVFLIVFIDTFGFMKLYFEKDFETEFTYPLDVPDFPGLVHRFKNGEAVEHQPINNNYSQINFETTASTVCSSTSGGRIGLIILVKSAPHYFEKRAAIRATWGSSQYLMNVSNSIGLKSPLLSCKQTQLQKNLNLTCQTTHPAESISSLQFPIKLVFLLGTNTPGYKSHEDFLKRQHRTPNTVKKSTISAHYYNNQKILPALNAESYLTHTKQKSARNDHFNNLGDSSIYRLGTSQEIKQTKDKSTSQTRQESTFFDRKRSKRLTAEKEANELLNEEILKHQDIVQANFVDSYDNNTYKTMVGLRWAVEVCEHFQYAFLVDDDMYINVRNLIKFMEETTNYPSKISPQSKDVFREHLYAGKVLHSTKPMRRTAFAKWYLSLEEYPFNYFPPYMPAAAILMSKSVVEDFYYSSYFSQHFRFDDIYLAILAYKMNITPVNSNYFHVCHTSDGKCREDLTEDANVDPMEFVVARHGLTGPNELLNFWNEQKFIGRV